MKTYSYIEINDDAKAIARSAFFDIDADFLASLSVDEIIDAANDFAHQICASFNRRHTSVNTICEFFHDGYVSYDRADDNGTVWSMNICDLWNKQVDDFNTRAARAYEDDDLTYDEMWDILEDVNYEADELLERIAGLVDDMIESEYDWYWSNDFADDYLRYSDLCFLENGSVADEINNPAA